MSLLIAECLPDETAIDRVDPWTLERDDEIVAWLSRAEPYDDDVPLAEWDREAWEPPVGSWLEMRLGALRQLFTDEDE